METEDINTIDSCDNRSSRRRLKLVAVHLGLSNTRANGDSEQELARRLCERVMLDQGAAQAGKNGCPPVAPVRSDVQGEDNSPEGNQEACDPARDAVIKLVQLMEDDSSLNCGYSSNLSMAGQVECDASLMGSRARTWTGVGAVSGCRNPIKLAASLQDHCLAARPLGLVQPNLLVGSGAKRWMREHCPHLMVADSRLISAGSLFRYQKFKSAYDAAVRAETSRASGADATQSGVESELVSDMPVDTVGAIAVDDEDNFHCAISSGGIILKHKGRLGQACLPGAGCWAQDLAAATTTGVGELLSESLLARLFHEQLARQRLLQQVGQLAGDISPSQAIAACFAELAKSARFTRRADVSAPSSNLAGILAVSAIERAGEAKREFQLACGHNGASMCIGYMTRRDQRAQALLVRGPDASLEHDLRLPVAQTIRLNL